MFWKIYPFFCLLCIFVHFLSQKGRDTDFVCEIRTHPQRGQEAILQGGAGFFRGGFIFYPEAGGV